MINVSLPEGVCLIINDGSGRQWPWKSEAEQEIV